MKDPAIPPQPSDSDEVDRLNERLSVLEKRNAKLDERNEILEYNKRYWTRQWLDALICEDCIRDRRARRQKNITEGFAKLSDDDKAELMRSLDEPMSALDLLTEDEIENRKLKEQIATLEREKTTAWDRLLEWRAVFPVDDPEISRRMVETRARAEMERNPTNPGGDK